jgi:membrane protein implicated in regulation of membrane protease activity
VFGRYLVLQTPGWALAALGAGALVRWFEVDPRIAGALFALWVIKDFVLYPFLRVAYASGDPDPAAALVGERAIAQETLAPDGYVRIGAELWRAELPSGAQPVARGASVRVRAVRGLTLLVEADPPGATGPGG